MAGFGIPSSQNVSNNTVAPLFSSAFKPGPNAIIGFLENFMAVRSKLQEQVIAARLRAYDPAALFRMKLELMDRKTKIESQKAEMLRMSTTDRAKIAPSIIAGLTGLKVQYMKSESEAQKLTAEGRIANLQEITKRNANAALDPDVMNTVNMNLTDAQSQDPEVLATNLRNAIAGNTVGNHGGGTGLMGEASMGEHVIAELRSRHLDDVADRVQDKLGYNPTAVIYEALHPDEHGYGPGEGPFEGITGNEEDLGGMVAGILDRILPKADTAPLDAQSKSVDTELEGLDKKLDNGFTANDIYAGLGNLATGTPNVTNNARIDRRAELLNGMAPDQQEAILHSLPQHAGIGTIRKTENNLQETYGGLPYPTAYRARPDFLAAVGEFSNDPQGEDTIFNMVNNVLQKHATDPDGAYAAINPVGDYIHDWISKHPEHGHFVDSLARAFDDAASTGEGIKLLRNWDQVSSAYGEAKSRPQPDPAAEVEWNMPTNVDPSGKKPSAYQVPAGHDVPGVPIVPGDVDDILKYAAIPNRAGIPEYAFGPATNPDPKVYYDIDLPYGHSR